MDKMEWVFIGLFVFFVMAAIAALFDGLSDDKITLKQSQWQCTQSHIVYTPTSVVVGKMPITSMVPRTHCDEYKRK